MMLLLGGLAAGLALVAIIGLQVLSPRDLVADALDGSSHVDSREDLAQGGDGEEGGADGGKHDAPAEVIDWVSFFVEADGLIPVHENAGEDSPMVGALNPGSVVYGYYYDEAWACVVDPHDTIYYVKIEYVIPFGKNMSEVSLFRDDHDVVARGFSVYSSINSISGMTLDDVTHVLQYYPNLQGIEESVLLSERKYGINGYFILGVASQESGFGSSALARRKNNLFGLGAYDDSSFESALSFDTMAECVDYFCALITVYCENGRTTPARINERYASDELWANKVVSLMNRYANLVNERREGAQ